MGHIGSSPYDCFECNGSGDSECPCCGNEEMCEECSGTGLDSILVDVEAYQGAVRDLHDRMIAAGCRTLTWEWYDDQGAKKPVWLGRQGGEHGSVAIKDFLTEEGKEIGLQPTHDSTNGENG